jgi:Ni/Co efflux regulator RcnB
MKIKNAVAMAIICSSMSFSVAAFAQATSASIADRKVNQQARVAQGVKSGQMTAGETANVEKRESSINKEEHNMRKADDGHLTKGDKAALTRRQNKVSRSIYRDKHNAKVQ